MKLTFTFTIDEANAILKSLSQLPYEKVFQMIHSIQAQAAPQVAAIEANKQSENMNSDSPINSVQ